MSDQVDLDWEVGGGAIAERQRPLDQIARRRGAVGHFAFVDDIGEPLLGDRALDLEVVVIDRDIEPGQESGAEYDAGLRARGNLTVWFMPEAVNAWKAEPRTGWGGQPSFSALAIATALALRAVFRLALRQTEGLIASVLQLLGLDLPVPDHSTLSRWAEALVVQRPEAGSAPMHLLVDIRG